MRRSRAVQWALGGSVVVVGVATVFAMPGTTVRAPLSATESVGVEATARTDSAPVDSASPHLPSLHGVIGVATAAPLGVARPTPRPTGRISGTDRLVVAEPPSGSARGLPVASASPRAAESRVVRPSTGPVMLAGAMVGAAGGGMAQGGGMGGRGGGGGLGRASAASPVRPSSWARPGRPSAAPVELTWSAATPTASTPEPAGAPTTPATTATPTPETASASPTPARTTSSSTTSASSSPAAPSASVAPLGSTTPSTATTSPVAAPATSSTPVAASRTSGTVPSSGSSSPIASSTSAPLASAPTSRSVSLLGRPVGLGPDARAIDLTASALSNGALLTDQLLGSQEVTFEGAAYFGSSAGSGAFNAFTALYETPALQNGVSAAPTEALTVRFARPVSAVGFNLFAVQFDASFVASGLASGPSFTVQYESGNELRVDNPMIQDPTLYRLLSPSQRPDPLWWVFEQGGLISSFTVHAPIFFASRLGFGFSDVVGDLYLANLQVIDAPEPDVVPPTAVPEPSSFVLLGLGVAALAVRRRRR